MVVLELGLGRLALGLPDLVIAIWDEIVVTIPVLSYERTDDLVTALRCHDC